MVRNGYEKEELSHFLIDLVLLVYTLRALTGQRLELPSKAGKKNSFREILYVTLL